MDLIAKVIEWLNSPATPMGLKVLALAALVFGVIVWLVKPSHWADFEGPDARRGKRAARPPD